MVLVGTRVEMDSFKNNRINSIFEVSDLGPLAMILCIEAHLVVFYRTHKFIGATPHDCGQGLLKRHRTQDVRPMSTAMTDRHNMHFGHKVGRGYGDGGDCITLA